MPQRVPPAVSLETLRKIRKGRDALAAAALARIDADLGWYGELPAEDRSWVKLVAQNGVSAFIAWCERPGSAGSAAEIFAAAPPELTRTVSLQHTLQLVRAGVDAVEDYAHTLSPASAQAEVAGAILRYSREVAFSAAEVYARAAEIRGSWDARLEALVVDGLIRGERAETLASRASALGWSTTGAVMAVVGSLRGMSGEPRVHDVRRTARKAAADALVGIHSDRVLVLLGGSGDLKAAADAICDKLGPGPVVFGPVKPSFAEASQSVSAALSALAAAPAWPGAPRPVLADELLPERVLAGDAEACRSLIDVAYRPLKDAGGELLGTLGAYLECGRSLEAASRALYVHPNTVRYRLRRIAEICGWDPASAREAFVLQVALAIGRLADEPVL